MSDITFICPGCSQQIQAAEEHAGSEVECPYCHTRIIVPGEKPESTPGQKMKGLNPKLKTALNTDEYKPPTFTAASQADLASLRKKKKSMFSPGLIGGLVAVVVIGGAGVMFGPGLYDKYKAKQEAEEAAKNPPPPPPPPPEPSAAEIVSKMGDKYKTMTSFAASGKTTAALDLSELVPNNPAMKSISLTSDTAIRFAKPDLYRLEWTTKAGGATLPGAAWDAGKGNYVSVNRLPATKAKDRTAAFSQVSTTSSTLGIILAEMFFDDPDNAAASASSFAKTNAQNMNGTDCYVLTSEQNAMRIELWVGKKDFLIAQSELFLDGRLDDAAYKAQTNAAIKANMTRISKIRGTITETYSDIKVNPPVAAPDLAKPLAASGADGQR